MSSHTQIIRRRRQGPEMDHQIHKNLVDQSSKNIVNKAKRYKLMSYSELPNYMKDNEFILSYYRANWPLKEALFSIFSWHNETLNIWTHLIGFILFVGLTLANMKQVPEVADLLGLFNWSFSMSTSDTNVSYNSHFLMGTQNQSPANHMRSSQIENSVQNMEATRWPFFVFLTGSIFCLLSSSICHLFCCHSHPLNILLLRIDYVGITVMIITSFFPPIYYIFQCDPLWQFTYLGGITLMGVFTVVTLLSPLLSTNKFRGFRALLFSSMGLFGFVPAVHAVVINFSNPLCFVTLAYESAMAVAYLTGTAFYVSRIPERWMPGCFDLVGHSHQIFHVFVIMGALAHYGATLIFLEYRDNVGCAM